MRIAAMALFLVGPALASVARSQPTPAEDLLAGYWKAQSEWLLAWRREGKAPGPDPRMHWTSRMLEAVEDAKGDADDRHRRWIVLNDPDPAVLAAKGQLASLAARGKVDASFLLALRKRARVIGRRFVEHQLLRLLRRRLEAETRRAARFVLAQLTIDRPSSARRLRQIAAELSRVEKPLRVPHVDHQIEIYRSRMHFEARLARVLVHVDFDDVATETGKPVPFKEERYADTHGITIRGGLGQYAGRCFGWPSDYPPNSRPNTYAPGPLGGGDAALTTVRFRGHAAAFGLDLIDADHPHVGETNVMIRAGKQELARVDRITTPHGKSTFVGFIVFGRDRKLADIIDRVEITSGLGWPARKRGEGVVLDDFVFTKPSGM